MLGNQDSGLNVYGFGRLGLLIGIELSRIKNGRCRYIIELVSFGMEHLNIIVDQHTDFTICTFDLLCCWPCRFLRFPISN